MFLDRSRSETGLPSVHHRRHYKNQFHANIVYGLTEIGMDYSKALGGVGLYDAGKAEKCIIGINTMEGQQVLVMKEGGRLQALLSWYRP